MKEELDALLEKVKENFQDLNIIALSTADGFSIYNSCHGNNNPDNEKVAAISSSLHSLSNAAAGQLLNDTLQVVTLETSNGNIFFFRTEYEGKDCVLCVATGSGENMARARYFSRQIAEMLSK